MVNRKLASIVVLILTLILTTVMLSPAPAFADPGDIVINEIMQNPSAVSDSNGEWFELYNPTVSAIDIDGWTIRDDDFDSHAINNGGPLVIPAGGYLVLGNNADFGTNGGVNVDYDYNGGWFLSNSADEVILEDGGGAEIDRIEYDGGATFPDPTGASMSLLEPALDNNVGANWCTASTAFGNGDFGTPGSANDCPAPESAIVIINEIMNNPSAVSDSSGEWFELFNSTASDIDIDGWTIKDNDFDSHVISGTLVIPVGGYVVLGNNADFGTNGGVNVDYDYNGGWFLSNGADEVILLDDGLNEIDRVEYDGGPNFPDPTGASMSLLDPALDNSVGENWCTSTTPFGAGDKGTPGSLNNCSAVAQDAFIHEVQGSGGSVAITDLVIVEAIVVGDFQDGDQLLGFFIQEEDEDVDGDPNTSEGILAFCGGCTTDVAVGDKVQVTGWPGEYFDMSQIDAAGSNGLVTVVSSGNALPTASTVDLPAAGSTVAELTLEYVEGMLVTFPDTLVVSEYYQLGRFGQLVLTADERPHQFTDANEPDVAGYAAYLDDLRTRRIILDDDNNANNSALGPPDEPYYWPRSGLSISNLIRGGDSIDNLTGVLHWSWAGGSNTDAWRVRPVLEAVNYDFTPVIERPAAPEAVGGSFKVASFNVLNYFSTIDEGPNECGPAFDLDCRGADSDAEFVRQRDKIIDAVLIIDADVIGLMELENNATAASQDLVDGLNAVAGAGVYDFIDTGTIGSDAIKVGLIYKTTTAAAVGDFAILDSSVDPAFNDDKNRPALAQTFAETATGGTLTVAVNHLKSKGSSCDAIGDPDLGDGQANCNLTRTSAATALANWLATVPTNSGDQDFLIIGDLNSYRMEDPIDALKTEGYTDLLDELIGPDAYTYLFDGQLGYLDYAMSNGNLTGQVTGVTSWNINADEIPLFDYNDDIQDSGEAFFERESSSLPIFENNAYRASDHDPVIVGLNLIGPPLLTIPEIQGDGRYSPYQGEIVETTGIVTQITANGRDMWIQDPVGDGDPTTSDGIFVDDRDKLNPQPEIGDLVMITGEVEEQQFGNALPRTRIDDPDKFPFEIVSSGNDLPAPVELNNLPEVEMPDGEAFWEPLEGMLVKVENAPVIAATNGFGEFGILAKTNAKPRSGFFPQTQQIIVRSLGADYVDYNPERIMVDDATLDDPIQVMPGDRVRELTGVVDYTFSMYKLQPYEPADGDIFNHKLPKMPVSKRSGEKGDLVITTYNVENLFDLIDNPDKDDESSTPLSPEELETQLAKLALSIEVELNLPEILVVQEVENTEILQVLGDIVNVANGTSYDACSFETSDGRGIEVGFLWDTDRVDLQDCYQMTGPGVEEWFGPSSPSPGREPLVAVFDYNGMIITIIGNHFKSKGGDDPLYGVNWPADRVTEYQRKGQAGVVRDFVDSIFDADSEALVMVAGDLNDFEFMEPGESDLPEDDPNFEQDHPLGIVEGWTGQVPLFNLVNVEKPAERYTFVFDGNSQVLDHILVSPALLDYFAGVDILHFNAGYPADLGEDTTTTLRASDHDPVEARFNFESKGKGK